MFYVPAEVSVCLFVHLFLWLEQSVYICVVVCVHRHDSCSVADISLPLGIMLHDSYGSDC